MGDLRFHRQIIRSFCRVIVRFCSCWSMKELNFLCHMRFEVVVVANIKFMVF